MSAKATITVRTNPTPEALVLVSGDRFPKYQESAARGGRQYALLRVWDANGAYTQCRTMRRYSLVKIYTSGRILGA